MLPLSIRMTRPLRERSEDPGDPGVRVLHVVDGVLLRALRGQVDVELDRLVVPARHEVPARGVDADRVEQLVERRRRPPAASTSSSPRRPRRAARAGRRAPRPRRASSRASRRAPAGARRSRGGPRRARRRGGRSRRRASAGCRRRPCRSRSARRSSGRGRGPCRPRGRSSAPTRRPPTRTCRGAAARPRPRRRSRSRAPTCRSGPGSARASPRSGEHLGDGVAGKRRQLRDVVAAVPVLGRLLAATHRLDRRVEPLHLRAGVVVVVLALHLVSREGEEPRDGVAVRPVSRVRDRDRPRRVRRHHLDLDVLALLQQSPLRTPGPPRRSPARPAASHASGSQRLTKPGPAASARSARSARDDLGGDLVRDLPRRPSSAGPRASARRSSRSRRARRRRDARARRRRSATWESASARRATGSGAVGRGTRPIVGGLG